MNMCTSFLLLGIFAYTNSLSRIKPTRDHRVVNLPQETVLEYSNKEHSRDINNLDNVYNIITRGTTVQNKNKNLKLAFRAARVDILTDFIQEAIKIIDSYEDTAFEDFFHVLDSEIKNYHYRGCEFSELMQNSDSRSLLTGSLKSIRGKSVSFMKTKINEVADMLRDEKYDQNVKELLDYINSLYTNTELNFHSVLNELKYYRDTKFMRTHNNLVQVIRGGVRAVLFNPYTKLNTHTRRELKERIERFWKQFKNNPASSAKINDIPYTDPVIKPDINSFKISENIMNVFKNIIPYFKNDPQAKSTKESQKIDNTETFGEEAQRVETETDESSNQSGKQIINYNIDQISSSQWFDSSSNSIKNSQERHEEYNTQRYMTLYTEEISFKAKTTKKTEIMPISANVMTRRSNFKKRSMTMFTPRERDVLSDRTEKIDMLRANHDSDDTKLDITNPNHDKESGLMLDSMHEPRVKENHGKQQKHGKLDESNSKSKQNYVEIISQHDAVINVQLANTELLKSLRMF